MKGERKIVADTVITRVAPSTGAAFDDTLYFGMIKPEEDVTMAFMNYLERHK
ncbi:unnamed protein product, partial [Rotaria sp. Silwood1]